MEASKQTSRRVSTSSKRLSSASWMSTSQMTAVFPAMPSWSRRTSRIVTHINSDESCVSGIPWTDMVGSVSTNPDFSRPILSSLNQEQIAPAKELGHASFSQLIAMLTSVHEREVCALREELELLRRTSGRQSPSPFDHRGPSPSDEGSEQGPEERLQQPPSERKRESSSGLVEERRKTLCLPPIVPSQCSAPLEPAGPPASVALAVFAPSGSQGRQLQGGVLEGASAASTQPVGMSGIKPGRPDFRSSHDVHEPLPCQVIKVPSEIEGSKLRRLDTDASHCVGRCDSEDREGPLAASPTSTLRTSRTEYDALRRFSLWPVWEQLSGEAGLKTLLGSRVTLTSITSEIPVGHGSALSRFISDPASRLRICWNFLALAALGCDLVMVPLQLFDPPESQFDAVLGLTTLVFWNFDILANFLVGYWDKDGTVVIDPNRVAYHYLTSWLLPDLLLVTVDWVLLALSEGSGGGGLGRLGKSVRFLRALRYLRLLRLLKTKQLFEKAQILMSEVSSVRFSIVKWVMAILVINHLIGCFWWGVGSMACEGKSWTYQFVDAGLLYQYTTSFHWSISQFGVGNVEIEAESTCERIFCIAILLFALVAFSSMVSSITNAMAHLRRLNDRETQLALFRRYCMEQRVSTQLMHRIVQYVNCVLDQQRQSIAAVDVGFLKLLSEPLYEELQTEIYEPYLRVHLFFDQLCTLHEVCTGSICRNALTTMFLAPRDVLFYCRQVAHRMYFVESGLLRYAREEDTTQVPAPEWFSEPVLWTRWLFVGHMQALVPCELVALGAAQFQDAITMHPATFRMVKRYAQKFTERLNGTPETDLSDLDRERNATTAQPVKGEENSAIPAQSHTQPFSRCFRWWQPRPASIGRSMSSSSLVSRQAETTPGTKRGSSRGPLTAQVEEAEEEDE